MHPVIHLQNSLNPITKGGGLIQSPPTKYHFKSGYLGDQDPQNSLTFPKYVWKFHKIIDLVEL